MFSVYLPERYVELARAIATLRTSNDKALGIHRPPVVADAELVGVLGEMAFAIDADLLDQVSYLAPDQGWDFVQHRQKIDVKTTSKHEGSWLVPEKLRADLYVFAWYDGKDTVKFRGMASTDRLERIPTKTIHGAKMRLVYQDDLVDIPPKRGAVAACPLGERGVAGSSPAA